jgi:hypothetical protein
MKENEEKKQLQNFGHNILTVLDKRNWLEIVGAQKWKLIIFNLH